MFIDSNERLADVKFDNDATTIRIFLKGQKMHIL